VLPARLVGTRDGTGGKWEALFLRLLPSGEWEMLATTRGRPDNGTAFTSDTGLTLTLTGRTPERHWLMRPARPGTPAELLARFGSIPLPPYIRDGRAQESDSDRYQTVYATVAGSVAAPTAGLHFTPELLSALAANGVRTARVTLHVGLGTFAPVKEDDPLKHAIHAEWCEVSEATATVIRDVKSAGTGRVIAVGTTSVRTLETSRAEAYRGDTSLFITPGHSFAVVDAMITNFHLPRTTLLLLVQALAGSDLTRRAYAEAIANDYRFFSYGDAMLVV
jgi:S-adenosylmethionine:tRNA ribosyltransferase-isomerase